MALCGLWHGAGWNFILWGAYHGMLLAVYRAINIKFKDILERIPFAFGLLVNFILISYGWLLFRAESFEQIVQLTGAMFGELALTSALLMNIQSAVWIIVPVVLIEVYQYRKSELYINRLLNFWGRPMALGFMIYLYFTYALSASAQEFIYFRF